MKNKTERLNMRQLPWCSFELVLPLLALGCFWMMSTVIRTHSSKRMGGAEQGGGVRIRKFSQLNVSLISTLQSMELHPMWPRYLLTSVYPLTSEQRWLCPCSQPSPLTEMSVMPQGWGAMVTSELPFSPLLPPLLCAYLTPCPMPPISPWTTFCVSGELSKSGSSRCLFITNNVKWSILLVSGVLQGCSNCL